MKILVCGSEGRIMSATIPFLLEMGHEVIGVDSCEKWGEKARARQYRFVQGSCSDPAVLRPLLKGVDGVIQAAATLFGVMGFHRRAADILGNDLQVHHTVLRSSQEAGVNRVVYMSSSMVYEQSEREPYREDDIETTPVPKTDYGLSKLVGERLSKAFYNQYGLQYTIWRPFNVIDPAEDGSDDPGVSHVFADLVHRMIRHQQNPIEVLGDGNQVRSFVHIREMAEALARFSFDARTLNESFNLGRNECVSVKQLASKLFGIACDMGLIRNPRPLEFRSMPVATTDVKRRVGCFDKVVEKLGWVPRVTLDESLRDCVKAFCERDGVACASPILRSASVTIV